ncbi:hypothetical protein QBC38DRAFT_455847 [Podospora fimiseda]|uniref:Uncharacterized protein n=1 Tax=Podospora fimiseda TaxID=252190 RepID=A0AAN7BNX2_9PEZI|nr:hypothetical protein QBC38DRAFT_455847 [Podospora fimiseda]
MVRTIDAPDTATNVDSLRNAYVAKSLVAIIAGGGVFHLVMYLCPADTSLGDLNKLVPEWNAFPHRPA